MSTKKTTDTTNKYDPSSMSTFQSLQPGIGSNLNAFMQGDRLTNARWQLQQKMLNAQAGSQRNAFLNNVGMQTGGSINPYFVSAQLNKMNRANSGVQSNAFLNNLMYGDQLKLNATQLGMGYHPLQTGQSTVEKTSGLGTWLPQVIGAGVGLAGGLMTGGAGFLGMGAAKAGSSGLGAMSGLGSIMSGGASYGLHSTGGGFFTNNAYNVFGGH